MTQAIAALGVLLKRDGNTIAELTKIGEPGKMRDLIDCTNLNTVGGYKEFIGSMRDGGELAIEGNFIAGDTDGQIGLQTDFDGETAQSFVLYFPTAITATWTFSAVVKEFKTGGFEVGSQLKLMATLKITGAPVLAITASTGLTTTFFSISGSAVIVPAPANAVYEYVATVLTGVASVTCTPIASTGVITVNGNVVGTGVPSGAIALGAAGSITDITIVQTNTGKTAVTYVIHVARATA